MRRGIPGSWLWYSQLSKEQTETLYALYYRFVPDHYHVHYDEYLWSMGIDASQDGNIWD